MITALASLIGFLSSMVPHVFEFLVERSNREYELRKMQEEAKLTMSAEAYKARAAEATAQAEQLKALYATYTTKIRWVDALNGTVRPVLAYAFFVLYAVTKLMIFREVDAALPWSFEKFWGEEDMVFFSWVIGFYFGTRGMNRARGER